MSGGDSKGAAEAEVLLKELTLQPAYIQDRMVLWEKFKKRADDELASKTACPIKIAAVDKAGEKKTVDGESWKTSPYDVARQIGSKSWAETLVIAKVNGVLWDLDRPLEDNCAVDLLNFDDNEGNNCHPRWAVSWRTSS